MFLFCNSHVFKRLLAPGFALSLGERAIGVIARHFCLPVLFQDLGQPWMAGQRRRGLRDSVQFASPVSRSFRHRLAPWPKGLCYGWLMMKFEHLLTETRHP